MDLYSIKDLDRLSGIKAHTIRVWERRFKIVRPERTGTNRRRYDESDLRKIINVSILRRNGFKISAIAEMSTEEIEEKVLVLSHDVFQSDTQVDTLVKLTVNHDEKAITDLMIRSMVNRGLEDTIESVMFPLLKRIGILWQTGAADIGSEHFVTNLVRQKLIAAIDALPLASSPAGGRVMLFLPENEIHELGLLFYFYLVRKAGHESIYLGLTTPLEAAVNVDRSWNSDIVITGLVSGSASLIAENYLKLLVRSFHGKKLLVAGRLADIAARSGYQGVFPVYSSRDLKSHLV